MATAKLRTKAQSVYICRFIIRCAVFLVVAYLYLFRRDALGAGKGFFVMLPCGTWTLRLVATVYWMVLILEMLRRMIPGKRLRHTDFIDIGCSKQFARNHAPVSKVDAEALRLNMRKKDIGALRVAALWLVLSAAVLALRLAGVLGDAELLLLWALCYLLDIVCILFFCPLQTFLMKNRCCATCRIFRWDHFLTYTVLAFIPSFFTISLFAVSLVELVCWEWTRRRYPERFWEGSNENLQCKNCTDRLCEYKKAIHRGISRHEYKTQLQGK